MCHTRIRIPTRYLWTPAPEGRPPLGETAQRPVILVARPGHKFCSRAWAAGEAVGKHDVVTLRDDRMEQHGLSPGELAEVVEVTGGCTRISLVRLTDGKELEPYAFDADDLAIPGYPPLGHV